jgi:hypothetical protein
MTTNTGEKSMLAILCILIGIFIGQHIQITASPELTAFFTRAWAWRQSVALPTARSLIHQLMGQFNAPTVKATLQEVQP